MSAAAFKAQCLAVLDRVAARGEVVVVTKRGRPVAQVVPIKKGPRKSTLGSVTFHGDIVEPIGVTWDAER
jgi:prevent-host-death family protein